MIRLRRLFENHLADKEVSADELRGFVEDFLGRIKARTGDPQKGTLFSGIVAAVEPLFNAFDAALSHRATVLAGQEGGTISKDDALRLVKTRVRQREGRVRDALGKGTAGYEEFFPRGLSEYSKATLAQVPALLDRFIAAAQKHATAVGAPLATEFQGLKTTFTSAREGQVDLKGDVAQARSAVGTTRTALELAVMGSLLDLAKAYLGQPEIAEEFYNQSLLEDPTRSQEDDPAPPTV